MKKRPGLAHLKKVKYEQSWSLELTILAHSIGIRLTWREKNIYNLLLNHKGKKLAGNRLLNKTNLFNFVILKASKSISLKHIFTIFQTIHLCLPSLVSSGPRFESQAHHLRCLIYLVYLIGIIEYWKWTENGIANFIKNLLCNTHNCLLAQRNIPSTKVVCLISIVVSLSCYYPVHKLLTGWTFSKLVILSVQLFLSS